MTSTNYSLWAIPAFWVLVQVPLTYAFRVARSTPKGYYDAANPRSKEFADVVRKQLGPVKYGKFERARAAHNNSLENFAPFAAAIIMGNMAGLPIRTLHTAAALFLVFRALYIPLYINITSQQLAYTRTLVFNISAFAYLYLMAKSAAALSHSAQH